MHGRSLRTPLSLSCLGQPYEQPSTHAIRAAARQSAGVSFRKLQISLPPELTRLLAELEAAREKCAAFRGRDDGAEEQKAAREETRAAIVARIAEMGSQAAAVEVARFHGSRWRARESRGRPGASARRTRRRRSRDRQARKREDAGSLAVSAAPRRVGSQTRRLAGVSRRRRGDQSH